MIGSKKELGAARNTYSDITLGSLTHVGMKRSSNEDTYCALAGANSPPGTDALLAVADGMGGHSAGEVASAMAIKGVVDRLSSASRGEATPVTAPGYAAVLEKAVQEVNTEIHRAAARAEFRGMGTTLTAAILVGRSLFIAHVGDSRAYLLRKGKLQQLTKDHSWVAEQVARQALTPQQAREHPQRNILTRALGIAPGVQVDTLVAEVEEKDVILHCSDGLYSLLSDEEIRGVLACEDPQEACQSLVERANVLGGHDNVTVVVARIDRVRQGEGPSHLQSDLHQMTTMELHAAPPLLGRLGRLVRMLLSPLWLPFWLVWKVTRLMFRSRN